MAGRFANDKFERCLQDCPFIRTITISDKGLIYRQGDNCAQVYWIVRGIIKLDHLTPQGNALTIALLHRGDLLGCLEDQAVAERMDETAQAIGEAYIYRFERTQFRELLTQRSDLAGHVIDRLTAQRRQAERKLRSVLTQSVQTRVIETLKELSGMFGKRCTHGYALEIHLTQQDLADLVGANRSVVSTIMNDLRNYELLDYTRDLICVHDRAFVDFCKPFS